MMTIDQMLAESVEHELTRLIVGTGCIVWVALIAAFVSLVVWRIACVIREWHEI